MAKQLWGRPESNLITQATNLPVLTFNIQEEFGKLKGLIRATLSPGMYYSTELSAVSKEPVDRKLLHQHGPN